MSFRGTAIALIGAVGLASIGPVQAQNQRVEQEDLLITDPTVAERGAWLVGASVEGWYLKLPYPAPPIYPTSPALPFNTYGDGSMSGGQYGGSVQVGYDNFWLQAKYLTGSWTGHETFTNNFKTDLKPQADAIEIILRYAFRDTKILGITPFILALYEHTKIDASRDLTSPAGARYIYTGSDQLRWVDTINTFGIGLGGLVEITDKVGFRFDGVLGRSKETERYSGFLPAYQSLANGEGTGWGGISHLSLYYRITDELTVQVGGKYAALNLTKYSGPAWDWVWGGAYVSLGWIRRF